MPGRIDLSPARIYVTGMTNAFPSLNEWMHGEHLWRLVLLFAVILAGFLAGRIGRWLLLSAARRFDDRGRPFRGDVGRAAARGLEPLAFAIALKAGVWTLPLPDNLGHAAATATSVLFVVVVGYALYVATDILDGVLSRAFRGSTGRMNNMLIPLVRKSVRVTIVILTLLQAATLLSDKPVTSLLAGLGVGGLAVALAAQETIKNFFGSLVILADKPFDIGDRVTVEGHDGTIESVGFRSTRLRTLDGHLVTLPNGELANKTLLNISRRPYIRRNTTLALPYDTPPDRVRRAVEIAQEILRDHEGQRPELPPRVFFRELAASALEIQMIYWYHPPDFWRFVALNERVNLELIRRFRAEGIEFAFPTQTVHLKTASPGPS